MCTTKGMGQTLQKMAKWFRRFLPGQDWRSSRAANDPGTAAPKQASATSSVTELTHHLPHARDKMTSLRTKEEIADMNAKYASRAGMPVSSEYQLMVGGDP